MGLYRNRARDQPSVERPAECIPSPTTPLPVSVLVRPPSASVLARAMAIRSLTLLLGLWLLRAEALEVPQHNCESYFSYYRRGNGEYYGLFTAPRAGINSFSWEVVFTAHGTNQVSEGGAGEEVVPALTHPLSGPHCQQPEALSHQG